MTDTLIIRHETVNEAIEEFGEQIESDEDTPHVVAFADVDELGKLLTERRMETIEAIMTEEPDSIRELARILDRGTREVHEDVEMLSSRGVVDLIEDGRAKKPRIHYDNVHVEVDLPRRTATA